jgi:hypothetical protein
MKLNHEERLLMLNLLDCELLRLESQIEDLDERVWKEESDDPDWRIEREIETLKELRQKKLELEAVKNLKDKIDRSIQVWNRI